MTIESKPDSSGIDIRITPGTKGETVHIPVIVDADGLTDVATNDFYIGEGCEDILIVAGCGIRSSGCGQPRHGGLHCFHTGNNARVTHKETHHGSGAAAGRRILNSVTDIRLGRGSRFTMESTQIEEWIPPTA